MTCRCPCKRPALPGKVYATDGCRTWLYKQAKGIACESPEQRENRLRTRPSKRSGPSGLQVSYQRVLADLRREFERLPRAKSYYEIERILRGALPDRQRERLRQREERMAA